MGVGLRLTGYPRDEKQFLTFLHSESCNPIAALRILKALKQDGVKLTTVQSSFNFARLGDEFQRLGVKMEVVPPAVKSSDTTLDSAALDIVMGRNPDLSWFSPDEVAEIHRRAEETGTLQSSEIGPYL
jgi:hypothetical protein